MDPGPIEAMETRAHITTRRPRRVLAGLAVILVLLGCAALSAAAFARTTHTGHRSTCASVRRGKHRSGRHCSKHHDQKTAAHKKKPAAKTTAPAQKLGPALCEDGSLPTRAASGEYTCEDGSEPACVDGSEPLRPAISSAPVCRVSHEEEPGACKAGGECEEFACEDPAEAAAPSAGCEYGSAFEEETEPAS
jgi:hypothetical protein